MPAIATDSATHLLLQQLAHARRRTDDLFAIVKEEFLYERPIPERHRIIFYIGHLEAFDWNLLHERVLRITSLHPELDRLFAFGIDPVGGGLPNDQPADWPSIAQVQRYVRGVRSALDDGLSEASSGSRMALDGFSLETFLNVAVEHRLMHAETLAYMFHQLPLDAKLKRSDPVVASVHPVVHRTIEIPAGEVTLGLPRESGTFGWDNEFEQHSVHVPAFSIDQYMVTNRQFLEFMHAGGYETRSFWTVKDGNEDDWKWKSEQGISHPVYWKREGNRWMYRTMFEDIPLPLDWPVYVSQAEAQAYARWEGKSLPTEAEWHRAAYGTVNGIERNYPWGDQSPDPVRGNFDFARCSPAAVNSFPDGQSAFGAQGMLGNGWEWTSTEFGPLPGFEPFPFYRGYSADFFDGKHFVLKGGSPLTAACMLRRSFRNWFQPHYQYAYTGFRCVTR